MQKPLLAVLLASAFCSLNASAADLIQVYQQALANDATFASARASAAAGRESCRISSNHADRALRTTDWAYLAESDGRPARLYRKPDDIWEVNDLQLRYPDDCDQLLAVLDQKEQT